MALNAKQYETLSAALGRIIPADETAGAPEAGALDYITGQFDCDLSGKVAEYAIGLDAMDAEAVAVYRLPFAQLGASNQDVLLTSLENGTVQTQWPINPRQFFMMIVHHTAEGFYSDPANGGNRDAISWEMMGF